MGAVASLYKYTNIDNNDKKKMQDVMTSMHYRGVQYLDVNVDNCILSQLNSFHNGLDNVYVYKNDIYVVADTYITNKDLIKEKIDSLGYKLTSNLDEELIAILYKEFNKGFVECIEGAFAIIIYDAKTKKMYIVRDRIGEKTLYYAEMPYGVVCSTELKTILKQFIHTPQINYNSLLSPIRFTGGIDKRNTFIEQIKRVEPGEIIVISNEAGALRNKYWERKRTYDNVEPEDKVKDTILQMIQSSVNNAMTSDKKVAVMLSGGIDSSAIAALAKKGGYEVHTITAGYSGSHAQDERDVAKRFASEQGFIYHELEFTPEDYKKSFAELTDFLDEPMTDSTAIVQWMLFRKVKEMGFDILLGGMGGDELFYGYPAWNKLGDSLKLRRQHEAIFPFKGKKKEFMKFVLKNWKWLLLAGYPSKLEDKSYGWWIHDDYYKFIDKATLKIDNEIIRLKDHKVYKSFAPCSIGKEVDLIYDDAIDTVMTQAYLYLTDRLAMAHNLEVRSPLLDVKLMEYVMSLPLEMKYQPGKPKQFFKDILAGIVPDYILYAQKRGFTSPNSFINEAVNSYSYKCFESDYKFYNSVLADSILHKLLK